MIPARFGIRGRLFLAFGMIASISVLSSIIAWVAYTGLGQSLERIVDTDIPAISLASDLAEKGGVITATAPILAAADDEQVRSEAWDRMAATLKEMDSLVKILDTKSPDLPAGPSLQGQLDVLSGNLSLLDRNVRRNFWFTENGRDLSERLRWAHADFLDEVEPLIDDAQFNIGLQLGRVRTSQGFDPKLVSSLQREMNQQEALLGVKAAVNTLVGLISRATNARTKGELEQTRLYAGEITDSTRLDLARLGDNPEFVSLRQSVDAILEFSDGGDNIFTHRTDALAVNAEGRQVLTENGQLVRDLQDRLSRLVTYFNAQTAEATNKASLFAGRARSFLVGGALGSIVIAILVVWLYVGRSLIARISGLKTTMARIAEGDLRAPVPTGGSDEISSMADSLQIFRDTISDTQADLVQAGKLAALGQLSAGIAHELNQPLAAIRSFAHNTKILIERDDHAAALNNVGDISRLSARMAGKINHLKTLARKSSRDISVVNLNEVVAAALDLLRARIDMEEVDLKARLPEEPLMVMGGAIRLEQVLLNLIGNALDAVAAAENKRIIIETRTSGQNVTLRITDSGPGMDDDDLAQIFDPFFTTKDVGAGLGLGLTISYNIIKDFGGSMKASSREGEGTVFSVILKRAVDSELRKMVRP